MDYYFAKVFQANNEKLLFDDGCQRSQEESFGFVIGNTETLGFERDLHYVGIGAFDFGV